MEGPAWWQGPVFKAQQEGRVVGVKQVRAGSVNEEVVTEFIRRCQDFDSHLE